MKRNQGDYGYLSQYKKKRWIITAVLILAMAIMIGFGYYRYHTMKTIFTVVGILFSLPIAKVLSGLLVLLPMKPLSEERKNHILESLKQQGVKEDQILWDLALSSVERVRHFPCVVFSDQTILVLYEDGEQKKDTEEARRYVRNLLKNNCHKEGVLLLTKETKFLEKAGTVNWTVKEQQEADRVKETILVYEM